MKGKYTKITSLMEREVVNLYKKELGTDIIAKKLNIGKTTVRRYLLINNIKFRLAPKDIISQAQHNEFIKLYNRGLSIKQIANKCNSTFPTVRRHLIKACIKLKRRGNAKEISDYAHELTLEKAYVLGVVGPGDGFIEYNTKHGGSIALEAADLDFVNYFAKCLELVYELKPKVWELKPREGDSKPHYKVRLHSVDACKDILSYGADVRERTWVIPSIIKKASREIKQKYLQGFADSQGSVFSPNKVIYLCSRNKRGLEEMGSLLTDLDIEWRYCQQGIRIGMRRAVESFARNIDFAIQRKREALARILANYKVWKTPSEEIDELMPEILRLNEEGLSYSDIGRTIKLPVGTIWRRLKSEEAGKVIR